MRKGIALIFVLLGMAWATGLRADERLFGHLYEADLLPKGGLEFEQWITQESGAAAGVFSRWKTRQELEFGLEDSLSASLYLNWESSYTSLVDATTGSTVSTSESSFDGVSTEWKWRLLNPYQDGIGLLLYFEPRYSGTELELEQKLVLQKNLGESAVLDLNVTEENEYGYTADTQSLTNKLEFGLGLAYKFSPNFSAGLEGLNRRTWPEGFQSEASSTWYLGPNLHVASGKWWATLSVLPQIQGQPETLPGDKRFLDSGDDSKVETNLILGLNF